MTPRERLTNGLWYERSSPSVSVAYAAGAGGGAGGAGGAGDGVEPVLQFRRGAMNGRRVHVDLVLLGGERVIDVSFHPAAAVDVVRGHARRRSCDGNGWLGALVGAVVADGARWGAWSPPAGAAAPAVFGGLAHPVLGAAYDDGVEAASEVPRWASAGLAEDSVPAAAVRLFGVARSTRRVMAALARFLVSRRFLAWWQLGAAVAAADVLEPDELAAVLLAAPPAGSPPEPLPSTEDVAVLREGLRRLEHGRARRLLTDAVSAGGEAGLRRLTRAMRTLVDLGDDVRWPPPVRLAELEALLLRTSPIDLSPATGPARPGLVVPSGRQNEPPTGASRPPGTTGSRAAVPTARAPAGPVLPAWTTPRRAPPVRGRAPAPAAPFVHDERVRRRFGGVPLTGGGAGDLELVLPRTPQELATWGRILDNCLADFAAAVAERRSVIVGVRRSGALVAALELRPDSHEVVQFLGPRNRVPPAAITTPVLAAVS